MRRVAVVGLGGLNAHLDAQTSLETALGNFAGQVVKYARWMQLIRVEEGKIYPNKIIRHGQAVPAPDEVRNNPITREEAAVMYRDYIERTIGIRVKKPGDAGNDLDPQRAIVAREKKLAEAKDTQGRVYRDVTAHIEEEVELDVAHFGMLPSGYDIAKEAGFAGSDGAPLPDYADFQRPHFMMMRALAEAYISMGKPVQHVLDRVPRGLRAAYGALGLGPGEALEKAQCNPAFGRPIPKAVVAMEISNTLGCYLAMALNGAERYGSLVDACDTGLRNICALFEDIQSGQALFGAAATFDSVINLSGIAGFVAQMALATTADVSTLLDHPSRVSMPFYASRKNFVMGEGGGVVLLCDWDLAHKLGLRIFGELVNVSVALGNHTTMDTAAPTDSIWYAMVKGIILASRKKGMTTQEFVNRIVLKIAHGTSTGKGDGVAAELYERLLTFCGEVDFMGKKVVVDFRRDLLNPLAILVDKGGPRLHGIPSAAQVLAMGYGHMLGGASSASFVRLMQLLDRGVMTASVGAEDQIDPEIRKRKGIFFPTTPLKIIPTEEQIFGEVDSLGFGGGTGHAIAGDYNPKRDGGRGAVEKQAAAMEWSAAQFVAIENGTAKAVDYVPKLTRPKSESLIGG